MAGTILINETGGVALNSLGYQRIIEAIREEFSEGEADVRSAIYEGNDLACMNFISVKEQDAAGFQIFERAALAAYEKAEQHGQTFAEWDELMAQLAADTRSLR
jgi:hypothetical protein